MFVAASLLAAEARPHKYSGGAAQSVTDWPISDEPTTLPSCSIRLPFAWPLNSTWAPAVTTVGYTRQHSSMRAIVITKQGRSTFMGSSREMEHVHDNVDQLDADE